MNNTDHNLNYRWYILVLAALTHTFVSAMPQMCLPVLFKEISDDLGLSLVQIGIIWGISALPSIFTGLFGGAVGDRIGAKRTLVIACILSGTAGALRGFSNNFTTLVITIFLFGLLIPIIPMSVHKTCGIWFSRRQLGLANGTVSMGMALGFMAGSMISATILSPLLGGWRNVLIFYGVISIAFSLPWYFSRATPNKTPGKSTTEALSLRRAVSHVARLKNVWLLGLTILGIGGCIQGMLGYLPLYLRELGWTEASADGALATFHGASMICTIPIALLSDRLGSRRTVLMVAALMIISGVGLLSVVDGLLIWGAIILTGTVRDGFMALFMTMIIETKGVGAAFAGTAIGVAMIFSGLGNLLSPPLGNSLAEIAPSLPFLFWSALAVVGFLGLFLAKEDRPELAPA